MYRYVVSVKNGEQVLRTQDVTGDRIPQQDEEIVLNERGNAQTFTVVRIFTFVDDNYKTHTVVEVVGRTESKPEPGIFQYYRKLNGDQ